MDTFSKQYPYFCRIACAGLVLFGLTLVAFSYRETRFSCQRSDGQCTISPVGLYAGPDITFDLENVRFIRIENSARHTGDPDFYRIMVLLQDSTLPINYTWVAGSDSFSEAFHKINNFVYDPNIPKITVQIAETNLGVCYSGLIFLLIGMVYTLVNRTAILARHYSDILPSSPGQKRTGPVFDSALLSTGEIEQNPTKEKIHKVLYGVWLYWLLAPTLLAAITIFLINSLSSLSMSFQNTAYQNFFDSLSRYSLMIIPVLIALVFFTAQAWKINHYKMNGLGWLACSMFGFMILLFIAYQQYLRPIALVGLHTIEALSFGSVIGIFQWPILRRRLSHASWWIPGSALAGVSMSLAIFLGNWTGFFIYSAISGAVLIGMLHSLTIENNA